MKKFLCILVFIIAAAALSGQTLFTTDNSPDTKPAVGITVNITPKTLQPGKSGKLKVTFSLPTGYHQSKTPDFFYIAPASVKDSRIYTLGKVLYPPGENYYGSVTLSAEITLNGAIPEGYTPQLKAGYQICSDGGTCLFPEEKTVKVPLESSVQQPSYERLLLLLKFILFAFIGGLLLNIMPCVLPILSLRALNLVHQSKNDKRSILISSLLYGGGVILSLLAMAVIVIILKYTGQIAGWGFQFQDPVFVSILMVIIFVFSLSLFDVYVINPPGMTGMVKAASGKGYLGSFFNGIFAVLLATPCTAPFLGAALGFAFSQSPLFIIASFTAIGAGFALPFVLLGIWPRWIQSIPKPGPWMDTFKELMGFLLLGTVLYLFTTLRFEINSDNQVHVILYLLIAAFIAWVYGKFTHPAARHRFPKTSLILALGLLIAGGIYFLNFHTDTSSAGSRQEQVQGTALSYGWEPFSPDLLEKYRNERKGVFVAFSAKWCTVCKINDSTIFHTERGASFFKKRNIALLYGDYTKRDPLIGEWIKNYGKAGVPVYAYYPPDADQYILLPEILTWSILEDKIDNIAPKKLDGSNFLRQPE